MSTITLPGRIWRTIGLLDNRRGLRRRYQDSADEEIGVGDRLLKIGGVCHEGHHPAPVLSHEEIRSRAVDAFRDFGRRQRNSPAQKDALAARVAAELGVDYAEILHLRMLQLMNAGQISEIAAAGIDVQLHTHRHRVPLDEESFIREIRDNRQWIAARTAAPPVHFCDPSGHHPGSTQTEWTRRCCASTAPTLACSRWSSTWR